MVYSEVPGGVRSSQGSSLVPVPLIAGSFVEVSTFVHRSELELHPFVRRDETQLLVEAVGVRARRVGRQQMARVGLDLVKGGEVCREVTRILATRPGPRHQGPAVTGPRTRSCRHTPGHARGGPSSA